MAGNNQICLISVISDQLKFAVIVLINEIPKPGIIYHSIQSYTVGNICWQVGISITVFVFKEPRESRSPRAICGYKYRFQICAAAKRLIVLRCTIDITKVQNFKILHCAEEIRVNIAKGVTSLKRKTGYTRFPWTTINLHVILGTCNGHTCMHRNLC